MPCFAQVGKEALEEGGSVLARPPLVTGQRCGKDGCPLTVRVRHGSKGDGKRPSVGGEAIPSLEATENREPKASRRINSSQQAAWTQGPQLVVVPICLPSCLPQGCSIFLDDSLSGPGLPPGRLLSSVTKDQHPLGSGQPTSHPLQKRWPHRPRGGSLNGRSLKTLVGLNQAILPPGLMADSKGPKSGTDALQSPVNSRGKRQLLSRTRSRSWEGCGEGYAIPGSVFS